VPVKGQRFTVDAPADLAAAIRKAGLAEGLSYRVVILQAVKRSLVESGYFRRGAVVLDPRARHRSGPQPIVDLTSVPPPPGE
jgi:hypothetical protein